MKSAPLTVPSYGTFWEPKQSFGYSICESIWARQFRGIMGKAKNKFFS